MKSDSLSPQLSSEAPITGWVFVCVSNGLIASWRVLVGVCECECLGMLVCDWERGGKRERKNKRMIAAAKINPSKVQSQIFQSW